MAYFPMFINIEGADCLIVGGGRTAFQKAKVLRDFGAVLHVTAPSVCDGIRLMSQEEGVYIYEREVNDEDFRGKLLVVAATDNKAVNHKIAQTAKKMNIHVNAVDSIEDCTFIFPSYHREKNVVAAYSSGGNSPLITQYLKAEGMNTLNEFIGDLAEFMGEIRPYVKANTNSEEERKAIYKRVLKLGLESGRVPNYSDIKQNT